jgi:hypothetical protein
MGQPDQSDIPTQHKCLVLFFLFYFYNLGRTKINSGMKPAIEKLDILFISSCSLRLLCIEFRNVSL